MDALVAAATSAVGERKWCVELVLEVGVKCAEAANRLPGLSGPQKAELVCQTILTLLNDAEKADKERGAESTEKESSNVPVVDWEVCRNAVKTILPVTLTLVVSAARGKFYLEAAASAVAAVAAVASQKGGIEAWLCCRAVSAEAPAPPAPQPPTVPQKSESVEPPKESESPARPAESPESAPAPSEPAKEPESA